jgi:hypothetical protein
VVEKVAFVARADALANLVAAKYSKAASLSPSVAAEVPTASGDVYEELLRRYRDSAASAGERG